MSWGFLMQGSDQMIEVEELGAKLSTVIHCPVHYPAYNKRMFECQCGVLFPVYFLKGNLDNWDIIIRKHKAERAMAMEMVG